MSITKTISHHLAAGCLAAALVTSLSAANPAAGTIHPADDGACSFDPAYLPRTPDAVEGWYANCRARQEIATRSSLPNTPDVIEAWGR